MEKIDITKIEVESIYYISTNTKGFKKLVRYKADDWCVVRDEQELQLVFPEEFENEFQRLILLNIPTDN